MRVLVIEDDRSVRETLGIVLESYNCQVDLVDGGERALEFLQTQWPDVVLLDLTLEGMSGEEVYAKIRETFGKTPPTVVISAVQHGEKRVSHMAGVRFLAKPYSLDQLMNVLREATASSSAA